MTKLSTNSGLKLSKCWKNESARVRSYQITFRSLKRLGKIENYTFSSFCEISDLAVTPATLHWISVRPLQTFIRDHLHSLLLILGEFNPLSANPTKWSNTLKQFVGNSRRITWVCLTILWWLTLKGLSELINDFRGNRS